MTECQPQDASADPLKLQVRSVDVGRQRHGEGLVRFEVLDSDEGKYVRLPRVPAHRRISHRAIGRPMAYLILGVVRGREDSQFRRQQRQIDGHFVPGARPRPEKGKVPNKPEPGRRPLG